MIATVPRPTIVTLCGSMRFADAFRSANLAESLAGRIALSPGVNTHDEQLQITREQKAQLDVLHFRRIDLSDEILVLNVDGYIGESTEREIAYAESHGISARYLLPNV